MSEVGLLSHQMQMNRIAALEAEKAQAEKKVRDLTIKMETQTAVLSRTADLLITKQNELAETSAKLSVCQDFTNGILDRLIDRIR